MSGIRTVLTAAILISGLLPPYCLSGEEEWSEDGWEQAYSRRNYQLGMTLSEFRAEGFPDQYQSFAYKDDPSPYVVCSNDADPRQMALPPSWTDAGIVRCRYYYKKCLYCDSSDAKFDETEAYLHVADLVAYTTEFTFIKPERSDEFFLYLIVSTTYSGHYYQLLEAYTAGMGHDPIIQTEIMQNSYGATFENLMATWENAVSMLTFEEYYLDLETSRIVLILKPLLEIANNRIDEAEKEMAKEKANRL